MALCNSSRPPALLIYVLLACGCRNGPSHQLYVHIEPALPLRGEVLSCVVTNLVDAYGPDASVELEWRWNGVLANEGATFSDDARLGDEVACTATVIAADGAGEPVTAAVVIQDSPSQILDLYFSPEQVYTTTELRRELAAEDPDDVVRLDEEWRVNDVLMEGVDAILGVALFRKGDQVVFRARATAAAGAEEAQWTSVSTAVLNSPPGACEVVVQPALPEAGRDSLQCLVSTLATDDDGEGLDYQMAWSLDGQPWTGAIQQSIWPGDGIAAAQTVRGQQWTCTVTPFDGEDVGPSASASVTIVTPLTDEADLAGYRLRSTESVYSGAYMAGVDDVDGDGLSDLLISAQNLDDGGLRAGGAFLVLGGSLGAPRDVDLDTETLLLMGEEAYSYAGSGVGAAGDFDQDGLADVLISAPFSDLGCSACGAVYLVAGAALGAGPYPLSDAYARLMGSELGGHAGRWGARAIGDVDGDGLQDLFMGSYDGDEAATEPIAGWLVLAADLAAGDLSLGDVGMAVQAEAATDGAGMSLARAGDLDGDGHADLLVGAPYGDWGADEAGAAFILSGAELLEGRTLVLGQDGLALRGESTNIDFGRRLDVVQNLDGAGTAAIAIAAHEYGEYETATGGQVFLFSSANLPESGTLLASEAEWRIFSNDAFLRLGGSLAAAGDADRDGRGDLLLSIEADAADADQATHFVVTAADLEQRAEFDVAGAWRRYQFWAGDEQPRDPGGTVAGVGDVDGDGFDDMALQGNMVALEDGDASGAIWLITAP